jgi:hypothetical protein
MEIPFKFNSTITDYFKFITQINCQKLFNLILISNLPSSNKPAKSNSKEGNSSVHMNLTMRNNWKIGEKYSKKN